MQSAQSSRCIDDLRRHGHAEIGCRDMPAFVDVQKVFSALPISRMFNDKLGTVTTVEGTFGRASFAVTPTDITNNMRWCWAHDEVTIQLFDAAAANFFPILESVAKGPVMVYSAGFVVVRCACLTNDEVSKHMDWGHPRIPRGASFTCLGSLCGKMGNFPSTVGGIRLWPFGGNNFEYKYRPGHCLVIDGKLYHRTEPFQYTRSHAECDVCETFENSGHVRVLWQIHIASLAERLALYNRKVMKGMVPMTALVRDHPQVYIDSESDYITSDVDDELDHYIDDDDDGEEIESTSLYSVLQAGTWRGKISSSCDWEGASEIAIDFAFDLHRSLIFSKGRNIGAFREVSGLWHCFFGISTDLGEEILLQGSFVRSPVSICMQGHYSDHGPGGVFCFFPPKPWHVPLKVYKEFPSPQGSIGLPIELGMVEVAWTDPSGSRIVTLGRAASWNLSLRCPKKEPAKLDEWLLLGKAISVATSPKVVAPTALEKGCVALVYDTAQRRNIFEELLANLRKAKCSALIIIQGCRPGLPRPARARGATTHDFPCFSVVGKSIGAATTKLPGRSVSVRHAHLGLFDTAWAADVCELHLDSMD